jgi:alkaline phosphatase
MRYAIALVSVVLFFGCTSSKKTQQAQESTPPNIIFLVGDGMGLSQVSSSYYFGEGEPNFSRFKNIGLSKTSSASHKITDSGAGANAFSTGKKTYNGSIAVDMDTLPLRTITEELSDRGWSVGMISTSSITHATPAAFYAHVKSRKMEETIALHLINSKVDFFAGSGQNHFYFRSDSLNCTPLFVQKGWVLDTHSLAKPITDYSKRYGYLMGLDGLPSMLNGRGDFLSQATTKAIDYFSHKKKPFFLLIEGSQIDWAGHNNEGDYLVQEVLDFDKVIGLSLDYAQAKGNTLVVVTADHETGGFTLSGEHKTGAFKRTYDDYNSVQTTFSTGGHSGALVPVFADGPHSELFRGVYENTAIYDFFRKACGLE